MLSAGEDKLCLVFPVDLVFASSVMSSPRLFHSWKIFFSLVSGVCILYSCHFVFPVSQPLILIQININTLEKIILNKILQSGEYFQDQI